MISGALSEMGVESSGGRWCGSANEVVVMAGHCICKREAGEGPEGQKSEVEPLGLDFGHTVGNWDGEQREKVVRWCG